LVVFSKQFISLPEILLIKASLGSHGELEVASIRIHLILGGALFSTLLAFSCASLLHHLPKSLLLLLKGESARPGNLCKLIRDEMFLRLNSLLSLSK
jgi:hypothetical protein